MAQARDVIVDLSSGELTAFSRFCSLDDFNLKFVGVGQIIDGHTKSTTRDLLYS